MQICVMVRPVRHRYVVPHSEHHPACPVTKGKLNARRTTPVHSLLLIANWYFWVCCSMLASSQCSGQSGLSCGGNAAGYSPWGPPAPHQFGENFYNNPIQYPAVNGNNHRYAITPNGQQPAPNAYFHQTPAGRSLHNHYPTTHGHTAEFQPYQPNGRKCNGR